MQQSLHWSKKHFRLVWWLLFILFSLPALGLLYAYYTNALGINPLETLMHTTGRWAFIMLIITLLITPLRRIIMDLSIYLHARYGKRMEDWNWMIKTRRMLGLYCFFYATIHTGIFLGLDVGFDWSWLLEDIEEKPYILIGMLAFVLLIPLAITSSTTMFNYLGKSRWRRLHQLTYVIAVLVPIHYWWQMKPGEYEPWSYTAAIILLLVYRLVAKYGEILKSPRDDGMEVEERGVTPRVPK